MQAPQSSASGKSCVRVYKDLQWRLLALVAVCCEERLDMAYIIELESAGISGTAGIRRVLMLAGISNSWLRMFDLMERMRNNLEKDHSLVRRFTGGVVHQVILLLQASLLRCHAVRAAANIKHRVVL